MLSTFAMLSVNSAKHLEAQRDRPFAMLRVTREGHGDEGNEALGCCILGDPRVAPTKDERI